MNTSKKRGRPNSIAKELVKVLNHKNVKCNFCENTIVNATNRIKSHLNVCKLCPNNVKLLLSEEFSKKVYTLYFKSHK
jgi:ribosomal protein L37AE/L43A